jgi:hypothetical protein
MTGGLTSTGFYSYGRFDFLIKFATATTIPFTISLYSQGYGSGYFALVVLLFFLFFLFSLFLLFLLFSLFFLFLLFLLFSLFSLFSLF